MKDPIADLIKQLEEGEEWTTEKLNALVDSLQFNDRQLAYAMEAQEMESLLIGAGEELGDLEQTS